MTDRITFVWSTRQRFDNQLAIAHTLTLRETVHATGRVDVVATVEWRDGRRERETAVRQHGPVNLDTVRAARLASGWSIVP